MPIGKDEWEEGRVKDTLESRILNFLRGKKPNAYRADEITQTFSMIPKWEPSDNWGNKLLKVLIGAGGNICSKRCIKDACSRGKSRKEDHQRKYR